MYIAVFILRGATVALLQQLMENNNMKQILFQWCCTLSCRSSSSFIAVCWNTSNLSFSVCDALIKFVICLYFRWLNWVSAHWGIAPYWTLSLFLSNGREAITEATSLHTTQHYSPTSHCRGRESGGRSCIKFLGWVHAATSIYYVVKILSFILPSHALRFSF
jgi:hypothetical protein